MSGETMFARHVAATGAGIAACFLLHPRTNDLVAATPARAGRPSRPRLASWSCASLFAPGALVVEVMTGHAEDLLVTSAAAAVLFLLAIARMAGPVLALERVLTQRHALPNELSYLAAHDELTGLVNRRHWTGDELLRVVAQRLQGEPRGEDCLARLGGDEFAMFAARTATSRRARSGMALA